MTRDVPAHARPDYWRAAIGRAFPGLAVEWLRGKPVHARLDGRPFASAHVTTISNTAARVTYAPPRQPSGEFQLVLQLSGKCRYLQDGCDSVQEAGSLILLDTARPFDCVFHESMRVMVWNLPRAALARMLTSPERAVARPIPGDHGLGAVLASHARALAIESTCFSAAARETLLQQLCGLIALAFSEAQPDRILPVETRRRAIAAYVEANLRDGQLTAERAARDLKISRRWLYASFERQGMTFAAWVARRRSEECRRMLLDPGLDHLSIANIAFRCGFNDLSTFNRHFRAQFHMTPRDCRRRRSSEHALS